MVPSAPCTGRAEPFAPWTCRQPRRFPRAAAGICDRFSITVGRSTTDQSPVTSRRPNSARAAAASSPPTAVITHPALAPQGWAGT